MLDRVDDEVTDDALDTAFVDLGRDARGSNNVNRHALALGEIGACLHDASDNGAQVAVLSIQQGAGSVVAGDLQQVGEHLLHAFGLVVQELGGSTRVGWQFVAVIPHDVLRHADRRQRGAQLMGDVGNEALLELGQLVVARDRVLERGCHRVEGVPKVGHLVVPVHVHAHVEVALRRLRRSLGGDAHGQQEAMQQREHTDRQGHDDRKRGKDEDPQDHVDLRLIGGQRVENVELVRARAGQLHLGADENSGDHLVGVAGADANRLPLRTPT